MSTFREHLAEQLQDRVPGIEGDCIEHGQRLLVFQWLRPDAVYCELARAAASRSSRQASGCMARGFQAGLRSSSSTAWAIPP